MKKRGFTIVELLLYMGLSAILITVVSDFFVKTATLKLNSEDKNVAITNASFILEEISKSVRNAYSIDSPLNGGSSLSLNDQNIKYLQQGTNVVKIQNNKTYLLNDNRTRPNIYFKVYGEAWDRKIVEVFLNIGNYSFDTVVAPN